MQQKLKICKTCGNECFLFSKGRCKQCAGKEDFKPIVSKNVIKKISKGHTKKLVKYQLLRDAYLEQHPICEACKVQPSGEIHHKGGRVGNGLLKYFLAVCRICHIVIEENPEWAKELGLSISRLKKEQNE